MDELYKKYKDLSKGLSHEEILSHGFSIEHISKECSNGGFGLTANISNHTLERFTNGSLYICMQKNTNSIRSNHGKNYRLC